MGNFGKYFQTIGGHGKYFWMFIGGLGMLTYFKLVEEESAYQKSLLKMKQEERELIRLNPRERTFIKFASCEHKGQLFMTAHDFLDSIISSEPRPRLKRVELHLAGINKWLNNTPIQSVKSKNFLRAIHDNGIISYVEYLFLLTILMKPIQGFEVAFNMLDIDGNKYVEKDEFNVILKIIGSKYKSSNFDELTRKHLLSLVSTKEQAELLFKPTEVAAKESKSDKTSTNNQEGRIIISAKVYDSLTEKEKLALERKYVNTSLTCHLFAKNGKRTLSLTEYKAFLLNLQNEVFEFEFESLAGGGPYISISDFATALLLYSHLSNEELECYLNRIRETNKNNQKYQSDSLNETKENKKTHKHKNVIIVEKDEVEFEKGVSLKEYKDFMHFLNQIDDFQVALRIFILHRPAISKEEFERAYLICTGKKITRHLLDIIYLVFDVDGDGRLSYMEFVNIMQNRLSRGIFKSYERHRGYLAFLRCVKNERKK